MNNQLKIILAILGVSAILIVISYIAIDNGRDSSLDTRPAPALIASGNQLMDKGEYKKAIKYYTAALKHDKEGKDLALNDVRVDLAICYINVQDFPSAKTQLDNVLALQPQHAKAHYNMGVWYINNEMNSKAVTEFEKYLEIEPNGVLADTCKKIIAELTRPPEHP